MREITLGPSARVSIACKMWRCCYRLSTSRPLHHTYTRTRTPEFCAVSSQSSSRPGPTCYAIEIRYTTSGQLSNTATVHPSTAKSFNFCNHAEPSKHTLLCHSPQRATLHHPMVREFASAIYFRHLRRPCLPWTFLMLRIGKFGTIRSTSAMNPRNASPSSDASISLT